MVYHHVLPLLPFLVTPLFPEVIYHCQVTNSKFLNLFFFSILYFMQLKKCFPNPSLGVLVLCKALGILVT